MARGRSPSEAFTEATTQWPSVQIGYTENPGPTQDNAIELAAAITAAGGNAEALGMNASGPSGPLRDANRGSRVRDRAHWGKLHVA